MEPARSRREARSHQITGLARWNAKDSSDLHSRADANALQKAQPRGNTTGAEHPTWRPNRESSWQTTHERGDSASKRCIGSTQPRLAVSARGVGPSHQRNAESGCRQREKGKCHEAALAWEVAGRIAEPDHTRGPSPNRPSRTAGLCLPRRSPRKKKRRVPPPLQCCAAGYA
jgi:hypothetical protein